MNQPFLHALHTLLEKEQINSVIVIAQRDADVEIDAARYTVTRCELQQIDELQQTADMAVLKSCLEHLNKKDGLALIARLRDVLTRRVLIDISLDSTKDWTQTDFIGMGFQCLARYEIASAKHEIYAFDLRHYKPAPDWLNAKFWANPQLWDKHRW